MNAKFLGLALALLLVMGAIISLQFRSFASPQTPAVFFIAGEIKAPGKYELTDGLMLQQAIALAKGTNEKATLKHTVIFRDRVGNEKRQEIPVDLEAIMKGEKEDIRILHNDIIVVPRGKLKASN